MVSFGGWRVGTVGTLLLGACSAPGGNGAEAVGPSAGESVAIHSRCAAESVGSASVRASRGVIYGSRSGQPLRFDIAWSDAGPPAPLVLLLHGGSWSGGSPASLHDEMHALARRGYAAAVVEYRLTAAPRNVFPAAAADVRCALRVLRRRAGEFNVSPERVAAIGYSAGGHLASMLGVAATVRALDEPGCGVAEDDVRVQAVISYAGPQDLRVNGPYTQEQADIVTNFLGVFPGDAPEVARLASPIAHVSAGAPPFLLVHGTDDPLVPVDHSRRMAAALQVVGTPATLLELPETGHEFVGLAASRDARLRCTVDAFLERWLR